MPREASRQLVREGLRDLPDNTIITSAEDGVAYLVRGGRREQIMNPAQLAAEGIHPQQSRRIELNAEEINEIPFAGMLALGTTGSMMFDSGDVFLGSGHYMHTWGTLDRSSGQIAAQTRSRTSTWFGEFQGSVHLILADAHDAPVWASQDHRYVVEGTWIGRSDRTDAWWETMSSADTTRVNRSYLFQSCDADNFVPILGKWVSAGRPVAQLAAESALVAKVIATIVG